VTSPQGPDRPPFLLRRTPHLLRLFSYCFITSGLASALAVLVRVVSP
jgi:hypothetical protein